MTREFSYCLRRNMSRIAVASLLTFTTLSVQAANLWYWGTVVYVYTTNTPDGSFQVKINNSTLNTTCQNGVVQVLSGTGTNGFGTERTKIAFSLAMLALSTDREFGIVVNLPAQGATCYAATSASMGAGIH